MPVDKTRFRRTVTGLYTGQEFVIRRISVREFLQSLGTLPVDASTTLTDQLRMVGEKLQEKQGDGETQAAAERFYLEHGVVEPKIFFGPPEDCPEEQIHFMDLADDGILLANLIAQFSFDLLGIKKKMGEVPEGTGAADSGHDSAEIQQAAVGPAPEGDALAVS